MTDVEAAALVEQYMPLALSLARRYAGVAPWLLDDCVSDASYALWKAATTWAPERATFQTWARHHIRWAILRRCRIERAKNPTAFAGSVITNAAGESDLAVELVPDPRSTDPAAAAELADEVANIPKLLAALGEDRSELVLRRVFDGEPAAAVAAERGTCTSTLNQLVRRALVRMREAAG